MRSMVMNMMEGAAEISSLIPRHPGLFSALFDEELRKVAKHKLGDATWEKYKDSGDPDSVEELRERIEEGFNNFFTTVNVESTLIGLDEAGVNFADNVVSNVGSVIDGSMSEEEFSKLEVETMGQLTDMNRFESNEEREEFIGNVISGLTAIEDLIITPIALYGVASCSDYDRVFEDYDQPTLLVTVYFMMTMLSMMQAMSITKPFNHVDQMEDMSKYVSEIVSNARQYIAQ